MDLSDDQHRAPVNLWWFAFAAFGAGACALAPVVWLALSQRQKIHRALIEQTKVLVRAQQDLALAARMSAVGAVTSHLIHSLRNPLSGLQQFMANRTPGPEAEQEMEWRLAAAATRQMQSLVNEVVRVLRENTAPPQYEVSLQDLVAMTSRKLSPVTAMSKVRLEMKLMTRGNLALSNRSANLVFLILENLIQNATQVTPSGESVTVEIASSGANVLFAVRDRGRGLPDGMIETLFAPGPSTKEMGSGLGLAISRQLALALGAELSVRSNTPNGCVFLLTVQRS